MHSAHIFSPEKLQFFKSRFLETLLGASFSSYPNSLFFLIMYLLPSAIIGFPMFLNDYYYAAINVSGAAGVLLLIIIMKILSKRSKTVPVDSGNKSLVEMKITKSSNFGYLLILFIATYIFFFLTEAFVLEIYNTNEISEGIRFLELVLTHLVTLTSSGSIFLQSPKEFASVLPDDRVCNLFSSVFMRPCYVIIVLIVKIAYSDYSYNLVVSIIYFALWPLWSLGILGGLMTTFLWGVETLNSLLFGDSPKNRFDLLTMSFIFNWIISVILTITLYFRSDSVGVIFFLILTLSSLLKSLDFSKFKGEKRLITIGVEYLMPAAEIVQVFGICFGFYNTFQLKNMYFDKNYQIILIILGSISAFFCVLTWLEAVFINRFIAFKIWKNCFTHKPKGRSFIRRLVFKASVILLSLFLMALSFARTIALLEDSSSHLLGCWVWSALLLRAYNQCWFSHLKLFLLIVEGMIIVIVCQLEPFWVIYFSPLLEIGNGFIMRASSRSMIFFYSLYKMKTTKSLRMKNPDRFITLSLTVLLPLNFINIFFSSLLNIPIIGVFGTPLFISGALRPRRLWPKLSCSFRPDFEASIYKALTEQIKLSLPDLIYNHPFEFFPEDYYLLRMGKVLGIFNVVERGFNYVVLNFRGLEMQEPTSCHSVESNSIDDVVKKVVDEKMRFFADVFTIMEPLTSMELENYDDNCFKLTGIIENRDFSRGLKELYLKIIVFKFQEWFAQNQENFQLFIEQIYTEFTNEIDISDILEIYPQNWSDFLHKSINSNILQAKESKIMLRMPEEDKFQNDLEKYKPREETNLIIKPQLKNEENDMLTLLDDLEQISSLKNDFNVTKTIKKTEQTTEKGETKVNVNKNKDFESKMKEVALHLFAISLNQRSKNLDSKINEETLFKLFSDGGLLKTRKWSPKVYQEIVAKTIESCQNALRLALKIALEIYTIEGHFGDMKNETLKESIDDSLAKWFIGNRNSEELFQAISRKTENIMCLLYDLSKKETNVLRATRHLMEGHVVKLNEDVIKSIWSNVIFELLYATNDDEERYSIQSHHTYLRNLIIQSSEEPLGYCPFYSGPFLVEY